MIRKAELSISSQSDSDSVTFIYTALSHGFSTPKGNDESVTLFNYQQVGKHYSNEVIERAYDLLINGLVPNQSKTFLATAAEFSFLCRSIVGETLANIQKYKSWLNGVEFKPTQRVTAERMAVIEAEMKKAGAQ